MLKQFKYTKANGTTSNRAVFVITDYGDKITCLDLSESETALEDSLLLNEAFMDYNNEEENFSKWLNVIEEMDLKHKVRVFLKENMEEI